MPRSHLNKIVLVAVATWGLDQLSKFAVLKWIPQWATFNQGAAFNLPIPGWLVAVVFIVLALLVIWSWKDWQRARLAQLVALGMVAGGAFSNMWDRLTRGAVVDFINLRVWPVFNLADTAIVVGLGLLLWYSWRLRNADTSHDGTTKQSIGRLIR